MSEQRMCECGHPEEEHRRTDECIICECTIFWPAPAVPPPAEQGRQCECTPTNRLYHELPCDFYSPLAGQRDEETDGSIAWPPFVLNKLNPIIGKTLLHGEGVGAMLPFDRPSQLRFLRERTDEAVDAIAGLAKSLRNLKASANGLGSYEAAPWYDGAVEDCIRELLTAIGRSES